MKCFIIFLIILSFANTDTTYVYFNDINAPSTLEDILNNFTFYDETDIDPKLSIIKDDYSINKSNLGNYEIIIQVTDYSNNKTTITILVRNIDPLHRNTPYIIFIPLSILGVGYIITKIIIKR